MIRRYSRPRHFTRRLDEAARGRARRTSSGLTTMPSPPRAGQLRPTRRSPPPRSPGRSVSTTTCARRAQQLRVGGGRARASVSMCQAWSLSTWTAPSLASRWNGASFRSSSDVDRPAVAPVGVDVARRRRRAARANALGERVDVDAARGRRSQRADRLGERGPRRPRRPPRTASRRSSCAFADHGISSQSSSTQSVSSSSHSPARVGGVAHARRGARASSAGVVEERPAGAGVARRRASPSTTPKRSPRRVLVAADDDDGARAHVLLLADDAARRPRCGSRRTPRPGARAGPARALVSDGDIVGGR